jgi:membrane protein
MAAEAESMQMERTGRPSVKLIAKETFREFKDDDVPEMAAASAYHAIFAIPPIIVFIVSLAALINQVTAIPVAENLIDAINRGAPGQTRDLLISLVDRAVEQASGGQALLGILTAMAIALWSGSNGVSAFMKACNKAYDVDEDRSFIKKKIISLGLTILVGVLVISAFALFVFGQRIGEAVANWLGMGDVFTMVWNILRWPIAIVFIMFVLAVLYYFGPNVEQSFRWISPGSVVATLLWILVVAGFNIYLRFSDPGSAYGAVGSVVLLLFFLYVSSIAFIVGAEVNAVIGKRFDPETVEDLARNPEKVEGTENQVAARERAEAIDRREDTNTAVGAPPAPRGRPAQQPGLAGRAFSALWSLVLAIVIARLRKPTRG